MSVFQNAMRVDARTASLSLAQRTAVPPQAWPTDLVEGLKAPGVFRHLRIDSDPSLRFMSVFMQPQPRPSYTVSLLEDYSKLQAACRDSLPTTRGPDSLRYILFASDVPGILNLGGDLHLIDACVRRQDRETLRRYAHLCCDIVFNQYDGFGSRVTTIAVVAGQALGGGFEAALSCNVMVAERCARFGLPEILFNLLPGMGAYSFLSRKLGPAAAERMIMGGQVHTAEELYELGLVDVLCEPGEAMLAARDYILRTERTFEAQMALRAMRHQVNPLTRDELIRVTDVWVETALNLTEKDLGRIRKLVAAQDRRQSKAALAVAAE